MAKRLNKKAVNTGGRAQPPYTVTSVQVTAMVPGQAPPMSSPPGSGPRIPSSRVKRASSVLRGRGQRKK